MTRKQFNDALRRLRACSEAVEWCDSKPNATPAQLWATCKRGDWMLWLAGAAGVDRRLLVLAACDCAETALKRVPKGEGRPAEAIRMARAWCAGKATLDEVKAAARAVYYAAYASGASACYGAYAAAAYAYAYADDAAANAHAIAFASSEAPATAAAVVRKRIKWATVKESLSKQAMERAA